MRLIGIIHHLIDDNFNMTIGLKIVYLTKNTLRQVMFLHLCLISCFGYSIESCKLNNIQTMGGDFKILNNYQYLMYDNYSNDTLSYYVCRSLSIEISSIGAPLSIYFYNLYDGRYRIRDLSMYPLDYENNYDKILHNIQTTQKTSCFPSLFFKTLNIGESFVINLTLPDVISIETIKKLIVVFSEKISNYLEQFSLKSDIINLCFAQQTITYAKKIFNEQKIKSNYPEFNLAEYPIIPYTMTDEYSSNKDYYLSIAEYYELSTSLMN